MTTTRGIAARRDREATATAAVLALPCGFACAGSVLPGLDGIVATVLSVVAALALLVLVARWAARWMRERREDRADARATARWRATHAPHLLTPADRIRLGSPIRSTVVGHNVGVVA